MTKPTLDPARIINGADAWAQSALNPLRNYPNRVAEDSDQLDRLFPLASPTYPSFEGIRENPKVFVTGTCIARTIENQLQRSNASVLSRDETLQRETGAGNLFGILTKYNLPAMLNEFVWALEPETLPHDADHFIANKPDEFVDLQQGGTEVRGSCEMLLDYRARFNALYGKVVDADIVIVPLAAIEVWYDAQAEVYLNFRPTRKMCIKEPDRFFLHVLDYQSIRDHLEQLHILLRRHCKETAVILYAITPAATPMTYQQNDAMHQSVYAKSLQRAALQDFLDRCDDAQAGYVPFYEATILQDQRANFIPKDYRHMSRGMGQRLVGAMMMALCPDDTSFVELNAIGTSECLWNLNESQRAYDVLDLPELRTSQNIDYLSVKALAAERVGEYEVASDCHERILQGDPQAVQSAASLARLAMKRGDERLAHGALEIFQKFFPDEQAQYETLLAAYNRFVENNRPDGRKAVTKQVQQHWAAQEYTQIDELLRMHDKLVLQTPNLLFQHGMALTKMQKFDAAHERFAYIVEHHKAHALGFERLIMTKAKMGKKDEIASLIAEYKSRFGDERSAQYERLVATYGDA